jgi:osmotically-inducible protein OsmY
MSDFNNPRARGPGRPGGGPRYPDDTAGGGERVRWGETLDERGAGRGNEGASRQREEREQGEFRDLRTAGERPSEWGEEWGEDWRGDALRRGGGSGARESGYGGYDPRAHEVNRYAADADIRESRYGYRRDGGSGSGTRRSMGGDDWRELQARDNARRGGQPSYGGGYFGSSDGGGQSYNGAQRVYPGDPAYGRGQGVDRYGAGGTRVGRDAGEAHTASLGSQRFGERGQSDSRGSIVRRVGPKGFQRSDERIRDDLCDQLSGAPTDVSDVSVEVNAGVVTLSGTVSRRQDKYLIEEIAEEVFGVDRVENGIRLARDQRVGAAPPTVDGTVEGMRSDDRSTDDRPAAAPTAPTAPTPGLGTAVGDAGNAVAGKGTVERAAQKEKSGGESGSASGSGTPGIFRV